MLFDYSFLYINIFSLILGVCLSWYFGGVDIPLHPDKLIASAISYCEKAMYRKGSYNEGLSALFAVLAIIFLLTAILLYFTFNAGSFWHFTLSTLIIYLTIDKRFSAWDEYKSYPSQYLSYAIPVIAYSIILGPAGAVLYRVFPMMSKMIPTNNERFIEFGKPAEQGYNILRDAANLAIPVILWIFEALKWVISFLKSFRP